MEIKINKIYKLQKKIGSGSFGEIYQVVNLKTNEMLAVKLEPVDTQHPQLLFEAKLYCLLQREKGAIGIPKVHFHGTEGEYNVMVMDLLGQSLEDLFNANHKHFDLKTVCMLGDQMIQRIQFLHSNQYLHRDIKPDNFLMHNGKVFMVDLGLAKKYTLKNNIHIPYKENKNLTGTARYASRNTHMGVEQSRRDDLESLGYVLVYLLKGSLPWQNQQGATRNEKYEKIKEKKLSTPFHVLCKTLPSQFEIYLQYCSNVRFEDAPDYDYLRSLLKEVMHENNYQMDYNYCFSQDDKINDTIKNIQKIEENINVQPQLSKRQILDKQNQLQKLKDQEEKLLNYVEKKQNKQVSFNQQMQQKSEITQQPKSSFVKKNVNSVSTQKNSKQPQTLLDKMGQNQYNGPKIVKYK